jgi:hypothetical protein
MIQASTRPALANLVRQLCRDRRPHRHLEELQAALRIAAKITESVFPGDAT